MQKLKTCKNNLIHNWLTELPYMMTNGKIIILVSIVMKRYAPFSIVSIETSIA